MYPDNQQQEQIILHPYPYSFTNKYCIGQGSFARVYKGTSFVRDIGTNIQTKLPVAIKQLQLANSMVSEQQINKQIQILKKLQHPNIVKYEAAVKVYNLFNKVQTNQYFYIITEYCNGGDLRNMLEQEDSDDSDNQEQMNKKVERLVDMFFQVCSGFAYLRKFDIIHRDLKPSNILIHNGVYKIGDFGVAKTQELNKSLVHNDIIGVPIYMSPQILSRNYYSYKCDIWSLGVIIFEFYFQKIPWKATDVNGLFFQIMSNPTPYLQQEKQLPPILKSIFDNTLRYLQKERLSWQQLLHIQKPRRKIFPQDHSRSKNFIDKSKSESPTILSSSQISKEIPNHQAQILAHLICQSRSIEAEITKLVGQQCYNAFQSALEQYTKRGPHHRQLFCDSSFFLLKISGENLHVYMMDLQFLEEARILHDLITIDMKKQYENFENFRKALGKTCSRTSKIDEYAAQVISKINTYRFSAVRNN